MAFKNIRIIFSSKWLNQFTYIRNHVTLLTSLILVTLSLTHLFIQYECCIRVNLKLFRYFVCTFTEERAVISEPQTMAEGNITTHVSILYSKRQKEMKTVPDDNIVIQLGEADKEFAIATHFPCSCLSEDELLIILTPSDKQQKLKKVQEVQPKGYTVHQKDKYSVFYIDTMGGKNTTSKELFRNNIFKEFKYLCVYGEKGMTVEEALQRDGHFIDNLDKFTLSDNKNPKRKTEHTQKGKTKAASEPKMCTVGGGGGRGEGSGAVGIFTISIHQVQCPLLKNEETCEEFRQKLRQVLGGQDELPDDWETTAEVIRETGRKVLGVSSGKRKEVRKLLKLGQSVCKVGVEGVCMGTGFVLFDNFILTNAHLFNNYVDGIDVFALFNYDEPEPNTNYYYFISKTTFIDFDRELDYAILELNPQAQIPNIKLKKNKKIPPGLLKEFGPVPHEGEACIIGHPKGEVKKMDPTCIIENEKRDQAVSDHLHPYKDTLFIIHSISQVIKDQGIENIMMGGNEADDVVTYNTFMYHGASGSPVFDARCKVFGLHTAGYFYGFPQETKNVIEFARPLLTIFGNFVRRLKKKEDENLLKRVEEEAEANQHLEKVLKSVLNDPEEPMDEG
uniref:Serine protease n=1 Tax=Anabas testudineus TaxID=64144 RepID=A0A7N6AER0_ANATE